MKTKTKIISLILILNAVAYGSETVVKSHTPKKTAKFSNLKATGRNDKLSTDIKFDGQLVGGKIQSPFESLTVVENEKGIDDLIGVRGNFSDRSQKSKGMR